MLPNGFFFEVYKGGGMRVKRSGFVPGCHMRLDARCGRG